MDWLGGKTESVAATDKERAGRVTKTAAGSGGTAENETSATRSAGDGVAGMVVPGGTAENAVAAAKDRAGGVANCAAGSGGTAENETSATRDDGDGVA